MMNNGMKVPKRIENSIMNALQGGVVPRIGLGYIAVGRELEIEAMLKDLEIIEDGGSTFRFLTGNYGSGKTFLLQTIKEHVISKGFVVADADLSPERSLVGSRVNKKGLATYRELMKNLSIKTSPEGGALGKVLDNWLDIMWMESAKMIAGGVSGMDLEKMVSDNILSIIMSMQGMVHGYDFSNILIIYWKAHRLGDMELKAKALRWLRGEYGTKTSAREELGVINIINDEDWFDYIKIWSEFFVKIGYKGFLIMIDEMINIYRYRNSLTRYKNYETMLMMYNDALQGKAKYLGIIMGGTPKALEDPKRGVYSYEALRSRLSSGRFSGYESINLMAPVIKIQPLTKSELAVLLEKIKDIHADLYGYAPTISIQEIINFIEVIYRELTLDEITPRYIIRDFINILNILYQNENETIEHIISKYQFEKDVEEVKEIVEEGE